MQDIPFILQINTPEYHANLPLAERPGKPLSDFDKGDFSKRIPHKLELVSMKSCKVSLLP